MPKKTMNIRIDSKLKKNLDTTVEEHLRILWQAMAEAEACTRIGAMLGGGNTSEIDALANYGRNLGVNFRLFDEIKDSLNLEGNLPHRIKYESLPAPILFVAHSSAERFVKVKEIVKKRSISPLDVKALVEMCFDSEAFDYANKLAMENTNKALAYLNVIKPSLAKEVLVALAKRSYEDIDAIFK